MQVVSIVQQKGGVGKTTLTVHLASVLAELEPSLAIAIADADPQQSAKKWIDRGNARGDRRLAAHQIAKDGEGKHMRKELMEINADLVLVDLPPSIESVSLRAALYANLILVPVGASALDIEAGRAAIDVCEEARSLDEKKSFLIVPSKIQASTAAGREIRSVLEKWGPIASTNIGHRIAYADAATAGEGIGEYAPNSAGHVEMKKLAVEVQEILRRVQDGEKAAVAC